MYSQIYVFAFDEGAKDTRYGIRANSYEEAYQHIRDSRNLPAEEAANRISFICDIEVYIDLTKP